MDLPKFEDGFCSRPEGLTFESKKCGEGFPESFWSTYSAFANSFGGIIALGLEETDDGRLKAVGVKNPAKIVKELWDNLNNREKVSINILTDKDIRGMDVNGKTVIFVRVPKADRSRRPVYINGSVDNGTYRRNGEGDYHCSPDELEEMRRDAGSVTYDTAIVLRFTLDDLDQDSIGAYRNLMKATRPSSKWPSEERDTFLRLLGAADFGEDGCLHPTAAGLLMFGKDYDITRFLSGYMVDYREYLGDEEWTYRKVSDDSEWSGNLFDFFMDVSSRLFSKSPSPFQLNGAVRIDDNEFIKAQRELVLNALIHADYRVSGGVRVMLYPDKLVTVNPGTFRVSISRAVEGGISDPRNPILMKMFMLIGMAEVSGQGMRRIVETCRDLHLDPPTFTEESEPMRVVATLPMWNGRPVRSDNVRTDILNILVRNPEISQKDLASMLKMSESSISRTLTAMKTEGIIAREGGVRKGRWAVLKKRWDRRSFAMYGRSYPYPRDA